MSPGIGGAARGWRDQLATFGTQFRAIAWDMPGYGGSKPLPQVSIAALADALQNFLQQIEAKSPILVGHSNGGDISMFFARQHPDLVKKVVTLDNLRVPFITDGKVKILSFRSKDAHFKPDPGVVPDDETCERAGIKVVRTEFQHNDLSDRGSDRAKASIQAISSVA